MIVWVDGWQLQCCGDPFGVGTRVSWRLRPADRGWLADVLGEAADDVQWAEERHGDAGTDGRRVEATVLAITAVRCRYAPVPDEDALYPVRGSGMLSVVKEADKWPPGQGGLEFVGYLVNLDTAAKPAR
ncbi:DUF6578 domain-containing protein [Nonomuraea sp. NPDC047897]|uniref:DUF6578 domain-containing protein n=1 Tax=Nonomuraea sp. NPDC047897 TaxID=3364346 RepID=UPI003717207D